jgi:3-dehydro-L-gulonate 2-dehydrogenase
MPIDEKKEFLKIPVSQIEPELIRVMVAHGFKPDRAKTCASVFIGNSLDGVYSHGINRFSRFIGYVRDGGIKPDAIPVLKNKMGGMEQWDGKSGPGPLNAIKCTDRAMSLASENGIGCVAIGRSNHWLRGGTYGWRAAKKGFALIAWSNTIANMPAWGAVDARLGNNPLVLAIPYQGEAIVVDFAMTQYSYGAVEVAILKGEKLGMQGGYDTQGNLTNDPVEIKKSWRALPIGYWKGSGLSLLLDLLATTLSAGLSVHEITAQKSEVNASQVFIAIDLAKLSNNQSIQQAIDNIVTDFKGSAPEPGKKEVRYPGENVLAIRAENTANGIPVMKEVWEEIKKL